MNRIVCGFLALILIPSFVYAGADTVSFPLKARADSRCLIDTNDTPFFYNADTAWMILFKLSLEEAEEYMDARIAQGFNALQIQLTGFLGAKTLTGLTPFGDHNDFSKPNEAFFTHADQVIEMAARKNLLLAIAPLWSGCCGEGWAGKEKDGSLKPMNKNGVEKCRAFGTFLGNRYSRFNNIMWIMGGDNDPGESKEFIRAVAEGIKDKAPHHLFTFHPSSSHSSTDVWQNEPRLNVVMVYTYFRGFNKAWNKDQPDAYEISYQEYNRKPVHPFFLGESTYEGEHDTWGSALQARKQAYWCALSGGFGNAYGSNNWNLPANWREVLQYPGAKSLKHYRELFTTFAWDTLIPDEKNTIAVDGRGDYGSNNYAVTAMTKDGTVLISYIPSLRTITYDLSKMSKPELHARWIDPTTGKEKNAAPDVFKNSGKKSFTPPEKNSDGDTDWILVIR